jgi:hypothetical protein
MKTDHLGGDILVGRWLSTQELVAALSSLLSVPPGNVFGGVTEAGQPGGSVLPLLALVGGRVPHGD